MIDSESDTRETDFAQAEQDHKDFEEYASYKEDDSLVVCDRTNANAWVKSDVLMAVED
jgi:hypothetical protein